MVLLLSLFFDKLELYEICIKISRQGYEKKIKKVRSHISNSYDLIAHEPFFLRCYFRIKNSIWFLACQSIINMHLKCY